MGREVFMTIITLPQEVEDSLTKEARKQGTTPELLAVDCLRKIFVPAHPDSKAAGNDTLYEFLLGYTGTVNGSQEALSEKCGERFLQALLDKQQRRPL
jgi:hypothetical protein